MFFVLRIADRVFSLSFPQNWVWKSSPPFLAVLPFGYELLVLEGLATLAGILGMQGLGRTNLLPFIFFGRFGDWLPCMLAWWDCSVSLAMMHAG